MWMAISSARNAYISVRSAVVRPKEKCSQLLTAGVRWYRCAQIATRYGSLFDSKLTDMSCDGEKRKLLMWLPSDARLLAGVHEFRSSQRYLMDCSGAVYAYIESLNAAVESEILMACDTNGNEILFRYSNTEHMKVISYEEAMSTLMDIAVAT